MVTNPHPNYERHAADWHEWSTDTSERQNDGTLLGKPQRLFVRVGDIGLIELVEAQVTSDKPEGRELDGKGEHLLMLNDDLAEWLIGALGKALTTRRSDAVTESTAPERKGNWMQTVGGRAFYPLDPRAEEVDIDDIAHALSFTCRFGGHCQSFYSVAEHCVRVSEGIEQAGGTREESFAGLLHDAAEAYIGDMVWPLKRANELAGYKEIEHRVERAIAKRFGLPFELPPIVKYFDLVLLSTEKRDLMTDGQGRQDGSRRERLDALEKLGAWHSDDCAALPGRIEPMPPRLARARFLERFTLLGGDL